MVAPVDKIVVGAYYADANGQTSAGAVYVYDTDGTNEVKIAASDAGAYDQFGYSVAVSDGKIVVGAKENADNGSASGSVYVYDADGTNEVKINASDGASGDNFGHSVAVGDNKIVVGSIWEDTKGQESGSAYVYDLDGSNEFKITSADVTDWEYFGYRVAVGENKIVVGSYRNDNESGSVHVYNLDGSNEVHIKASDSANGDYFGDAIAVGEGKIVVGARNEDENGTNAGAVYIYDLNGNNEVKLMANSGTDYQYFGSSVGVADGKIVVGAFGDSSIDNQSGAIYIYDLDGTNEIKITASDGGFSHKFGSAVAFGGS